MKEWKLRGHQLEVIVYAPDAIKDVVVVEEMLAEELKKINKEYDGILQFRYWIPIK